MTRQVLSAHPDHPVEECMALMTTKHIRHLPVIENGALVGLMTIGDAAKSLIGDKEVKVNSLENFILGS